METPDKMDTGLVERQPEPEEEVKKFSSEKMLFIGIGVLVIILGSFFLWTHLTEPQLMTLDDLHALNLQGKLDPEQGYLITGYSFVKYGDLWHTQILSPRGTRLYDMQFRYGPREVADFPISGKFNITAFNDAKEYYVTFDPTGTDHSFTAVAIADFNEQMLEVFEKRPTAACDRNETLGCSDRPIITCENTNDIVLYIQERNTSQVIFQDTCIIIQGKGPDLVKGVDRVLYLFYNILQ